MNRLTSIAELEAFRESLQKAADPNKTVVRICLTGCRAFGALEIKAAFDEEVKRRGLEQEVEVRATGCHGFCARAPVVAIDPQGIFYQQITAEDVPEVVTKTLLRHKVIDRLVYSDPESGKKYPLASEVPFYRKQTINVLHNCGRIDPAKLSDYIAAGGYSALGRVLSSMTPEQVIEEVKRSGLRGRGGAGFPTGLKWEMVRASPGTTKYLICNADEGDPGAFMDRAVLEGDPHSVMEGMIIAAYAMGVQAGYIYVRAEYPIAVEHLKIAVAQASEAGLLGKNILGCGLDFEIKIKEGAGAFVCGEETALMASIEGRRGMPRPRPPFPAQSGLWGKPTNINNVETYANVPSIVLKGADWYSSMGTEKSKGTKIFSLAGKITNTGLVEVPIGISMREVIFDVGGGILRGRKFKAVQMGGPSGGCVPEKHLGLPVDYDSLASIGSIMGSGGMVVMDENTCMVDIARYFLSFTQSESCGKCVPCRLGTKRMQEMLTRITQGRGAEGDVELLKELGEGVRDSSLCGLGQTCPNPVLSTINFFRDEYDAHIREKRCPAAVCEALVYAPCEHTCPVNVDAVGYVALIAQGRFEEALNLVREKIPLAGVCGRVCHHPCEDKCRRGDVDEPIAIMALKRFAADYGVKAKVKTRVSKDPARNEKVAIVGSGPAGLNAAYHLARKGYGVSIFEALPVAGGMLAVGIPEYRLPREVLKADIDFITSLGVDIKTNTPIDSLAQLLQQGYKAVFVAVGAHKGQKLGVPGEDLRGVVDGVSFLRDLNLGNKVSLGDRVAVIGGGNVAIDAARSALRTGSKKVTIVYRRTRDEMPANKEEIEEAEHEGIEFLYLAAPLKILGQDGKVARIECQRMELGDYDASGRRRPVPVKDSQFLIDVDAVIAAIGQSSDLSFLRGDVKLDVTSRGTLAADPVTLVTNHPSIFAGGDAVLGPATVLEAMATGERAAISIDRYLKGEDMRQNRFLLWDKRPMEASAEEPLAGPRVQPSALPIQERLCGFAEVNLGFTPKKAVKEAKRCLRCDLRR